MKKSLLFSSISLFLILVLTIVGCSTTTPVETTPVETLKVGSLLALTGWFSEFDIENDREIRVMAQMINEKGGITVNGQRYDIEIVSEDMKSTSDGVAAAANRLVYEEGVKYVVVTIGFFNLAAIPIWEQNKVINVCNWNSLIPDEMGPTTQYSFIGHNSSAGNYKAIFLSLKEKFPDVKTFVYTQPDDGSQVFTVPKLQAIGEENGFTMAADPIFYPPELLDFSSIAVKLNSIESVDAVIHAGNVSQLGSTIKSLRGLGNNMPYVGMGATNCQDIMTITGTAAATNIMTFAILPGSPDNPPLVNELCEKIEDAYGPSPIVTNFPNCLYMITQVIEAAQSLDTDVVKAKWESMDTIETIYGEGVISGDETFGIKHHAVGHPAPVQMLMDGVVSSGGWIDVGTIP